MTGYEMEGNLIILLHRNIDFLLWISISSRKPSGILCILNLIAFDNNEIPKNIS